MEILRFIQWWWKKFSHFSRCVCITTITVLLSLIPLSYMGVNTVLLFTLPFIATLVFMIFWPIYQQVLIKWSLYKYEKAEEAQKIVNKLRGQR